VSGVSNYTPDGKYLIGSLPGIKGFMAVTGCSGTGIASSAGFGRLVAQIIDDEPPPLLIWSPSASIVSVLLLPMMRFFESAVFAPVQPRDQAGVVKVAAYPTADR
jgi:glycine/D-amino acid oxidase-like deaminating enzyme